MDDRLETRTLADLTLTLRRPRSRLAELAPRIRDVLGHDLPPDVAAFYAESDGLHYEVRRAGEHLGCDASILGLEGLFDGFRPHRQYRSIRAYEKDVEEGALYDQPFCEQTWGDGMDVYTKGELTRLNALLRSKVVVSIPGESAWLTIDFADPKTSPYRLGLAQDGCDLFPLDLSFPDFVAHFCRFGVARFYFAFADRKTEKAMNIDFGAEVERGLADYTHAFPEEVAALVRRAKDTRTRKRRV
jgi:hypothetical protein